MKRKIFIASGVGGFIGTLVALSVNPMFWWIGMLIGGIIGYLSYDFREVLLVIKIAWRTTIRWRPEWKLIVKHSFWMYIFSLNFVPIGIGLVVLSGEKLSVIALDLMIKMCLGITGFIVVYSFVFVEGMKKREGKDHIIIEYIETLQSLTPFHVFLIYVPKYVPKLCRKGVVFIKEVIVLVHSDIRLLCGFDAAIGTAVGYYMGNPIIGMLGGGLIGILNYEVVSKKVLHAPKK